MEMEKCMGPLVLCDDETCTQYQKHQYCKCDAHPGLHIGDWVKDKNTNAIGWIYNSNLMGSRGVVVYWENPIDDIGKIYWGHTACLRLEKLEDRVRKTEDIATN